jgi:ubiquinone/menaquinone biosynthesis C-methylase UbiE
MKSILENKLATIEQVLDTRYLLNQSEDRNVIQRYYRMNRLAYKLFHNWGGFLHMGISHNGIYKKDDLLEQVREVEKWIRSIGAQSVLEIGSGHGANSFYLANRNPNVHFLAVDLSTKPLPMSEPNNLRCDLGDYDNLSQYEDRSFDVIFAIETICHSTQKEIVFREMYKKLKTGGTLIVFDGYLAYQKSLLTESQRLAATLIAKGMAVDEFESIDQVEQKMTGGGFQIMDTKDLSQLILPTLYKFERLAKIFFEYTLLRKIMTVLLPEVCIRNSLSAYLMSTFVTDGHAVYIQHVLKK